MYPTPAPEDPATPMTPDRMEDRIGRAIDECHEKWIAEGSVQEKPPTPMGPGLGGIWD